MYDEGHEFSFGKRRLELRHSAATSMRRVEDKFGTRKNLGLYATLDVRVKGGVRFRTRQTVQP